MQTQKKEKDFNRVDKIVIKQIIKETNMGIRKQSGIL